MGTQMERLVNQHFKELKKRSSMTALDENSKKLEKRKSLDCNLFKGDMVMDLKSVKVLVERTKFNEMQVVDLVRNIQSPIKIANGTLHKTPQKRRGAPKKKPASAVAPQRPSIDEHFRARRCYVKVSKDKQLIKLLHIESVSTEQKPSRGRPRKQKKVESADEEPSSSSSRTLENAGPATATSDNLKRKHTDTPDAGIQSKRARKNKNSEFFINIESLLGSPSPRRKSIKSNTSEEPKRRAKKGGMLLNPMALRQKFGNRFFKAYVKVKRHRENGRSSMNQLPVENEVKKKKKGKNLSVSFLETVEIFGESSDGEDYEEPSFLIKASRLKRLDNGALDEDDFATSTPVAASRTSQSSEESPSKPESTPKRKEKVSFSPLKEDDASPRKEQLKLANEKIVRLSFEEQPFDEEEPEPASPSPRQSTAKSESPTDQDTERSPEEEKQQGADDGVVETQEEAMDTRQDPESIEVEPELITPPPSEDKNTVIIEDDYEDGEDVMVVPDAKLDARTDANPDPEKEEVAENLENKTNLENQTQQTLTTNDEISKVLPENERDAADSFESAVEVLNEEEKQRAKDVVIDADAEEDADTDVELIEDQPKETHNARSKGSSEVHDAEDFSLPETTSQVNISSSSEHQFEDASELMVTVPLSEPATSDQTEVDAVLNDVCQLVADEASTLLSDHTDNQFESPHSVDVDDFTSVLTHPEVERTLQSAASSTLVPNSQEIVVAAAVSSQAAIVPPPDVDVTEDTFASVVAEVERYTKDVNPEIYSESVGITGTDVMMDNVQVRHSLDDIFDDDVDDEPTSPLTDAAFVS